MAGYTSPGGAGTVQGADPGKEADADGLAGAYQQIVGRNAKAQGPNGAAYDKQMGEAQGDATAYGDTARNYTQNAPTIANQYQDQSRGDIGLNVGRQGLLTDHLNDIMSGKDVTGAKAQIQAGTDAGIAAQMSMARSAKGGGAAQAGATRAAQQQGAVANAGVASQAGQLQAQLAGQAAGQAAGVYGNIGQQLGAQYGLEQGSAIQQANLQGQNQAQINQTRLGFAGAGNQAQAGSLNALNGYTSGNLSAQGLQPGIDAQNGGGKLIGTAASVAGAALTSDIHAKEGIASEGDGPMNRADAFMENIHPLSYHYKDAAAEPRSTPTGGRYLGISAQDLESVPEIGQQMVSEGPHGKRIESGPTLSAALAGIARLHERVKGLEGPHNQSRNGQRFTSETGAYGQGGDIESMGPSGEGNQDAPDYNYIKTQSPLDVATALETHRGAISPSSEAYMRREGMWNEKTDRLLQDRGLRRPPMSDADAARLDAQASRVMGQASAQGDARIAAGPAVGRKPPMSDAEAAKLDAQASQVMGRANAGHGASLAAGPSVGQRPAMGDAEAAKLSARASQYLDRTNTQRDAALASGPSVGRATEGARDDGRELAMNDREQGHITSDITAKTDISPEGDPRAAAWDQGANAATENANKFARMAPAELKRISEDETHPHAQTAMAIRMAKRDAYDEGHREGINSTQEKAISIAPVRRDHVPYTPLPDPPTAWENTIKDYGKIQNQVTGADGEAVQGEFDKGIAAHFGSPSPRARQPAPAAPAEGQRLAQNDRGIAALYQGGR